MSYIVGAYREYIYAHTNNKMLKKKEKVQTRLKKIKEREKMDTHAPTQAKKTTSFKRNK